MSEDAVTLPGGRRELFVYWKLPEAQATAAVQAARAMHAALRAAHPSLQCRLHRRAEVRQGQVTLMETYAHAGGVHAGHEAAIAAAVALHLAPWAGAPRHVEDFLSLDD